MSGKVLLAGDEVTLKDCKKIGPGLKNKKDHEYVAKVCGILREKDKTYYVDHSTNVYMPAKGDFILGIIESKMGEFFKVDINASRPAILHYLSFESATKKNRAAADVGSLIYARVTASDGYMEPEITCLDLPNKPMVFQVLQGGHLLRCGIDAARRVLKQDNKDFDELSKLSFEICVGVNGRIWLKSDNVKKTLALGQAYEASKYVSGEEIRRSCRAIVQEFKE